MATADVSSPPPSSPSKVYDLVVIGGGVVGLACLRAATLEGWDCALVEAEPDLLSHASGGNSGIACTGADAVPGSMERALIRESLPHLLVHCVTHNVPHRTCGSLVCLWPWDGCDGDAGGTDDLDRVLKESHDVGDTHAALLTGGQVLEDFERNLAPACRGAVHIPGEVVVDPWLYPISLAAHAVENGAEIYTRFPVGSDSLAFRDGIWTVRRCRPKTAHPPSSSGNGAGGAAPARGDVQDLRGRAIVNAAGIWADVVESTALGTSKWCAKPRRGQYRVYNANGQTQITHPIQPIPTPRTKGIFVFSTVYNQLVVGPTALDQASRTDRSVDPLVAQELDRIIQRVLPNLDPKAAFVGDYVGVRPGTEQRDYQIHLAANKNWIAVAGIRSTGLTASLGIGNYVKRQLFSMLPTPSHARPVRTSPLPSIDELVADYMREGNNGDRGYVHIHGRRYRVTHPLTRFGLESLAKEAKQCSNHVSKG